MFDYSSFYPWAVKQLPPLTFGEWKGVKHFVDDYEGFYIISGKVAECRWPVVLKSAQGFKYANNEYVRNLTICSYELREALRCKELELNDVRGWIWIPSDESMNPFKGYVEEFYKLKEKHREDYSQYLQNKLLLNSLYGKTYQAIRLPESQEAADLIWEPKGQHAKRNTILYRAGGLYLPHVGAWITSLCRAKLHEDMHRYEAIDCATDSFKTHLDVATGLKLGDLKFARAR